VAWQSGLGGLQLGWDELRETALGCQQCGLCATRTHVVFGEGNPNADLDKLIAVESSAGALERHELAKPFVVCSLLSSEIAAESRHHLSPEYPDLCLENWPYLVCHDREPISTAPVLLLRRPH